MMVSYSEFKRKLRCGDQLHRCWLLFSDMLIYILIAGLFDCYLKLAFNFHYQAFILFILIWSWVFAYRDNELNFDYFTYPAKIFVWSVIFATVYIISIARVADLLWLTHLSLMVWLFGAMLLRYLIIQRRPKFKFLVYQGFSGKLISHNRVSYDIRDSLVGVDLEQYNALLMDNNIVYPEAWRKLAVHAQAIGLIVVSYERLAENLSGKVSLGELDHAWVENSFSVSWTYMLAKRLADIVLVLISLPIWLPIVALVSVTVGFAMGWPVIFTQPRVGQDERLFTIYKFRTMRHSPGVISETTENDNRITNLGKWLRKFRLDELPQFINVIKGDMSLVGPRPEWQYTAEQFSKVIPAYNIRHLVKPGISGWAQINQGHTTGVDGNMEKLQYDIYYVKHYSLWLDIKIIVKTIKIIFTGSGAK